MLGDINMLLTVRWRRRSCNWKPSRNVFASKLECIWDR